MNLPIWERNFAARQLTLRIKRIFMVTDEFFLFFFFFLRLKDLSKTHEITEIKQFNYENKIYNEFAQNVRVQA